jgi:hypothetical protein
MEIKAEVMSCIPPHGWKEINKHLDLVELRWAVSDAIEKEYAKALKKAGINPDACWVNSVSKGGVDLPTTPLTP